MDEKKQLRKQYLAVRQSLPPESTAAWSEQINAMITASDVFQQAKVVMGYLAFAGEPNLDSLLQTALDAGKQVCVPAFTAQKGIMRSARLEALSGLLVGAYGIRALPADAAAVDPATIDLVLTPGLLFTAAGARLGLGGGYYDRFLPSAANAFRMGVLFEHFLVAELPVEPHDALVDSLVTEKRILVCHKPSK